MDFLKIGETFCGHLTDPWQRRKCAVFALRHTREDRSRVPQMLRHLAVEQVGIDKIKKLVTVVGRGIDGYVRAKHPESPGGEKVTLLEGIGIVLTNTPDVLDIALHIRELGLQFADLDEQEKKEVIEHFRDTFDIPNELAEIRVEIAFTVALNIAYEVKWGIEAWKAAGESLGAYEAAVEEPVRPEGAGPPSSPGR